MRLPSIVVAARRLSPLPKPTHGAGRYGSPRVDKYGHLPLESAMLG